MSISQESMTDKQNILEIFIYGELFELSAIVSIYDWCRKLREERNQEIKLLGFQEIFDTSEVILSEEDEFFEDQFRRKFTIELDALLDLMLQIKPVNEAIRIPDGVHQYQHELKEILRVAIERTLRGRSTIKGKKVTKADKLLLIEELSTPPKDIITTLAISSGFITGQMFVDWCRFKYDQPFTILFEASLCGEVQDYIPDLMVIQNQEVIMVGDLKSYFRFFSLSNTNLLKNILSELPVQGLVQEFLVGNVKTPETMRMYEFRQRFNILTRYFKLLKYMETVYKLKEAKSPQNNLDGLILFPTKPIYLKMAHLNDVHELQKALHSTICYNIRTSGKTINLIERLLNHPDAKVDLPHVLEKGDSYINNPKDLAGKINYTINIKDYGEDKEVVMWVDETWPEKTELEIGRLLEEQQIEPEFDLENIRLLHEQTLKQILRNKISNKESLPISVVIDGSDQGSGKNYSLTAFIGELIDDKRALNVLFSSPREEALLQTLKDLILVLKKRGVKQEDIISKLKNEGQFFHDFEGISINVHFIKSKKKSPTLKNKRGSLVLRYEDSVDLPSASDQLKAVVNSECEKTITIVFITSQTLPSYFNTYRNFKGAYNRMLSFVEYFDLVTFDELTNTSPTIRETFVDILLFSEMILRQNKSSSRIVYLVLDASLTSPHLFESTMKQIIENKDYFVPFTEKIKMYNNYPIEYAFTLKDTIKIEYIRYKLKYPFRYSILSIGMNSSDKELLPYRRLIEELEKIVNRLRMEDADFPSLESLLTNNQVLFYIDNKMIIDHLRSSLQNDGYNVSLSIREEKHTEEYEDTNVIGTSSLAFGTSFRTKRLLVVLPSFKGVEYFNYKINIELLRQVSKRMRGGNELESRLITYVAFPVESKNTEPLGELVSMNYFMLRNYVQQFANNPIYHQLPPFSSTLMSTNWVVSTKEKPDSIYHTIDPITTDEKEVSLEYFVSTIIPQLRRLYGKWDYRIASSFNIIFDPKKVLPGVPTPNYLCFPISASMFANLFAVNVFPLSDMCIDKFETYLKSESSLKSEDLKLLYNLYNIEDTYVDPQEKIQKMSTQLTEILNDVKSKIELSDYRKRVYLGNKLRNLLRFKHLNLSGSAFLFSLDFGMEAKHYFGKGKVSYFEEWKTNSEYLTKLFEVKSPLYTLYYGASEYYETPVTVKFSDKNVITVGFLTYYPRFVNQEPTKRFNQLLRKCLLKELFKENVIYIPNILKNVFST